MLDVDGATAESREQVNLSHVEKVVTLALEPRVGLRLDLKHNVSRQDTRHLITITTELDLMSVLDTLVNVDMEHLTLDDGLLTTAALAAVLLADHLTFTVAVGADGLEALDHGAHLAHHGLHTGTTAARAGLDRTFLTTAAIAARADHRLLQSQLRHLAPVDILQVNLVNVVDRPSLLGARVAHATAEHAAERAAAAEELREEVIGSHSAAHATTVLETLLTKLIVE